jgi:RNA recognition motif-containing protein
MSNSKLFVHGFRNYLSLEDRKTMLINLFSQYGKIKIITNPRTGADEEAIIFIRDKEKEGVAYKNFCFVEMEDEAAANAVLENCANVDFEGGIKISTSLAKAKEE